MIGTSFLCKGQRYNHIPGNIHMVYKDLFANHAKEYYKFYQFRNDCFDFYHFLPKTYDLNIENDCKEIINILKPSDYLQ